MMFEGRVSVPVCRFPFELFFVPRSGAQILILGEKGPAKQHHSERIQSVWLAYPILSA